MFYSEMYVLVQMYILAHNVYPSNLVSPSPDRGNYSYLKVLVYKSSYCVLKLFSQCGNLIHQV
jgi:hypothetical protein